MSTKHQDCSEKVAYELTAESVLPSDVRFDHSATECTPIVASPRLPLMEFDATSLVRCGLVLPSTNGGSAEQQSRCTEMNTVEPELHRPDSEGDRTEWYWAAFVDY